MSVVLLSSSSKIKTFRDAADSPKHPRYDLQSIFIPEVHIVESFCLQVYVIHPAAGKKPVEDPVGFQQTIFCTAAHSSSRQPRVRSKQKTSLLSSQNGPDMPKLCGSLQNLPWKVPLCRYSQRRSEARMSCTMYISVKNLHTFVL